jgi:hypothetical protein
MTLTFFLHLQVLKSTPLIFMDCVFEIILFLMCFNIKKLIQYSRILLKEPHYENFYMNLFIA